MTLYIRCDFDRILLGARLGDSGRGAILMWCWSEVCRLEDLVLGRPLQCLLVSGAGYLSPLALKAAGRGLIALELRRC
jgi:hypothetical protein